MIRRQGWAHAGAAVALLVSAGCAVTPGPSITKAQAMAVVNGYLQETFRAVPVPSPFTIVRQVNMTSCEYFMDSGVTGQFGPGLEYSTEAVGKKKGQKYLADVAEYWQGRPGVRVEWRALGTGEKDDVEVTFEQLGDYKLIVEYPPPPGSKKISVLGGLRDCIWENGTAPPTPDDDFLDPTFGEPSTISPSG
ncbi:hypothetical protein ACWEJ6_48435 [Nonomuraea sp. NPDC004702]